MTPPTQLILVTGADVVQREKAIAAALLHKQAPTDSIAVILEGLPAGSSPLDILATEGVRIARIAPGCMCCMGNLTLKVTLNRMLRHSPRHVFLSVTSTDHLDQLRAFLKAPPYATLLQLAQELTA